jgi:hypothetical protein
MTRRWVVNGGSEIWCAEPPILFDLEVEPRQLVLGAVW